MSGFKVADDINHTGMEIARAYGPYFARQEPAQNDISYVTIGGRTVTAQELEACLKKLPSGTFKWEELPEKCFGIKNAETSEPVETELYTDCNGKCDW